MISFLLKRAGLSETKSTTSIVSIICLKGLIELAGQEDVIQSVRIPQSTFFLKKLLCMLFNNSHTEPPDAF